MERASLGVVGGVDESGAIWVGQESCLDIVEAAWIAVAYFDMIVKVYPVAVWFG